MGHKNKKLFRRYSNFVVNKSLRSGTPEIRARVLADTYYRFNKAWAQANHKERGVIRAEMLRVMSQDATPVVDDDTSENVNES